MARRFELVEGSSSKFWEVHLEGSTVTVRFGRIGTNGQTQTKELPTAAKAQAEHDKLVKEKTGKGYTETGAANLAPTTPKAAAPAAPATPAKTKGAPAPPPAAPVAAPPSAAAAPAPSAAGPAGAEAPSAPQTSSTPGNVAWTDELRREMEAVRGVSIAPPLADPAKTWKNLKTRAIDMRKAWKNVLGHKTHGAIFKAAFERLERDSETPTDPALEAAILSIAEYSGDWKKPSYIDDAIDRLIALAGLPFALRAGFAQLATWVPPANTPSVTGRGALKSWGYARKYMVPFDHLRLRAATADDATYAAALAVARELHASAKDDVARAVLAYTFPGEEGWADPLIDVLDDHGTPLITATRDPAVIARMIAKHGGYHLLTNHTDSGTAARFAAILALAGPSKPVIDALFAFYDKLGGAEYKRGAASVLALVDTHEAIAGLASRGEEKEVQLSIGVALARSPALSVRALVDVAASRSKAADVAKQLLGTVVRQGVEGLDAIAASLTEAQRKILDAVRGATARVEPAPIEEVPEVLRAPRWLGAKKKPAAAAVEITPPAHPDAFAWPKGVREAMPRDTYSEHAARHGRDAIETMLGWLDLPKTLKDETKEDVIAAACASTTDRRRWGATPTGFGVLPEPLALGALKHTPASHWVTYSALPGFAAAVARFELRIADDVIRLADALATSCFTLLLPYDVARAAPVAARAYAELKKVRGDAERWLRLHPAAAIAGLLAPAVGKPGKPRSHAENALRFLAGEGHRDAILGAAKKAGALEAATAVLDFDPLDLFPSKIPALPDFADPARLSPPVLAAKDGRKGGALPPEAMKHLATMLAISRVDEAYAGLAIVKAACTKGSLAAFAWDLFTGWLLSGGSSKEQWAMTALAHLGDDECARKLAAKVREWPGESAHARAVSGLDVLAAMGTDVALMHLHGISQKLKFKGLQEKAGEKISVIAEARGLTEDELGDRLVPDLGLEDDGKLTLDFGSRAFTVTFDESLKPVALDAANKRLPDLPKPGKSDDADKSKEATERWKALKKDAKTIASQQVLRFELAMCARRRWTTQVFTQFLAEHPVVRHLVRRLVWATYGADGAPRALFRMAEDGSFADASDDVFKLAEGDSIGIAHALEMDATEAAKMGQVFADYEILQPFLQLGRETHALTAAEKSGHAVDRVKGKKVPTGKVLGLEARGWRRGQPQDGGGIWWMEKKLPDGLEAHLSMDPGIAVGMVNEFPEQTLGSVELYEEGQWSASGKPFGVLDAIVASELVRDLMGVVG